MRKIIITILSLSILSVFVLMPMQKVSAGIAGSDCAGPNDDNAPCDSGLVCTPEDSNSIYSTCVNPGTSVGGTSPTNSIGGVSPTGLQNPLNGPYNTLCQVLEFAITLVTELGAIVAVIVIIYTGFKFVTSRGNPTGIEEAKKAFFAALIGTAILLGASGIAHIIVNTVLSITNGGGPSAC